MDFRAVTKLSCILLFAAALAADEVADSRRLQQEALAAYRSGDKGAFLTKIRAASLLRPQHPTLLVQFAVALAANGRHLESLNLLERVAAMGFVHPLTDPALEPVRALPRFAAVAERMGANARPTGAAKREATIEQMGLIPEGMAYDAKKRRFFVSSVRRKTIFAIDSAGRVTPFLTTALWGVFGMAVDAKRNVLWATTTALPQVDGFTKEDDGKSALLQIDLDSGSIVDALRAGDGGAHHFGDVAIASDGEVFVSDSRTPVIYRVAGSVLEPYARGPFVSLQGIAPSEGLLYAADYAKGLLVIDRATRDVHVMRVPNDVSLLGVDGLYVLDRHTLIATQNGTTPNRVIRIRLTANRLAVESVRTLAANLAGMGDPTLGVLVKNRFFFNANAQWDLFGEDGRIADPLKLTEAVVMSVAAE
ncbi:MAG TPA: hypothetical protein VHK90_01595 [Thermoanaerobaculia bacterium]|nr:hypothetical protein [Thermoanaerobaculia bacterium]